jgi:hypothetical protein
LWPVTVVCSFIIFLPAAYSAAPAGEWWNDNYGASKQITITAGPADVPEGYSVSFNEDTASLLADNYLRADGNDWRIVYWNGSAWIELDRWVDDIIGGGWDSANTRTWFKTRADIPASSSDDNYYVYYGHAGETQPAPASMSDSMGADTASEIFWYADDFEEHAPDSDPDGWTDQGAEDFKVALHGSENWFQARTSLDWRDGSTATGMADVGDAVLSAKIYYHQAGSNSWGGIGVHIANGGVGRIVLVRDGAYHHSDETFSVINWIANADVHFPLGTEGRIELVARGTSLDAYWYNPAGYSPERVTLFTGYTMLPGTGKLAVYVERPWTFPGNDRWIDADDIIVRQSISSEPTLVLGSQTLLPDTCPVVTNTGDSGPGPLPAWPGSLRACIVYANTNPGTTISFDIPDTAPGFITSGGQSWWRISPGSALPSVTASGTVVDGTTQATNYGSDTNNLGPEIEIVGTGAGFTDGIVITGGSGTIRGLAVNQFGDDGIVFSTLDGNVVENCYIGLDPTGTIDLGNGDHGIIIRDGSDNNTIGGSGVGNVISGNGDRGIRILSGSGNTVQGNLVGTDPTGMFDLGNSAWGVHLDGASGNLIGGQNAGEGNLIAFNGLDGITIIGAAADGNSILGNSIHSNDSMGIDLNDDGVTPNNGTTGALPNIGMDYPVLTAAALTLTNLRVEGYVGTSALVIAGSHTIEVYKAADDGGSNGEVEAGDGRNVAHGEGQWYIDRCVTAADGTFICNLTVPGPVTLASGEFVTATATDPSGNSSEFGANLIVTPNTCPVVTNTADSGGGSLRACIDFANLNPNTTISFNIPNSDPGFTASAGNAWWRISPGSTLPTITAAGTTIDGATQAVNYGADTNSLGPEIEIDGTNSGNNRDGLIITGGNATVRSLVINRFDADGINLDNAGGNTVEDCYIGLDPTGTSALPNGSDGIVIKSGSNNNLIGGPGAGNVISGNGASGLNVDASDGHIIQGNLIGTDPSGTIGLGNVDHGLMVSGGVDNEAGGQGAGEGNIIAFNGLDGVFVTGGGAARNRISGNSIFSNGDLGIDLAPNGVGTGNKSAPVFASVANSGGNPIVTVTTDTGDAIEYFRVGNSSSPTVIPDATGSGEGFLYLGVCLDNGACTGPYMVSAADSDAAAGTVRAILSGASLPAGEILTATATDPLNETSEFATNAVYPLELVKQAFLASDGSLITNSSTLPRGTVFRFLIYTDNPGPAHSDVSIRDVLDPAFAYSSGSLRVDNSVASGASLDTIYSAVRGTSPLTDVIDGDVASVSGSTVDIGNQFVANGQLDIAANRVWALLFTVRMQ